MSDDTDFKSAIAALKAKRQAKIMEIQGLDVAIAELEALSGITPSESVTSVSAMANSTATMQIGASSGDTVIRSDEFWGMSMSDAAKKYLDMVKRPQSVNGIGEALKKGGYLSESPHYLSMVRNVLRRDESFTKVKSDWGLRKWYAGRSLPTDAPRKSKRPKTKKSVKSKSKEKQTQEVTQLET